MRMTDVEKIFNEPLRDAILLSEADKAVYENILYIA